MVSKLTKKGFVSIQKVLLMAKMHSVLGHYAKRLVHEDGQKCSRFLKKFKLKWARFESTTSKPRLKLNKANRPISGRRETIARGIPL